MSDNIEVEKRLLKLEMGLEALSTSYRGLEKQVMLNSAKMDLVISSILSQEKLLKYVVTPLILIVGAVVGIKLVV